MKGREPDGQSDVDPGPIGCSPMQLLAHEPDANCPQDRRVSWRQKADSTSTPCTFGQEDQGQPGGEVSQQPNDIDEQSNALPTTTYGERQEQREQDDQRSKGILTVDDQWGNGVPENGRFVPPRQRKEHIPDQDRHDQPEAVEETDPPQKAQPGMG